METRKLQEVGGGTFTVSIPRAWAENNGFEVGMELQLYTHRDGSILVRSSDTDINCLDEATIEAAGEGPEAVRRAVHTAHAIGFETIVLRQSETFSDPMVKAVRSTVRDLIGANILTETDTEITIKYLLDTSSISIRQSIVQLQYAVASLLRDATDDFVDAVDTHERIHDRADEARRSAEMVTRHFSRSLISHAELDALDMSRDELFACYVIASRLKTVTDRAVEISSIGKKLSGPLANGVTTDICSVADDVACSVDNAAIAVLSGDMTNVQQARNRCDSATETISAVESRLYDGNVTESTSTSAALANTLSSFRQVAGCGHRMADVAAMAVLRDENIEV